MFYLHLHCSAVIAHRITAADVMGKNRFSQDSFDPLICPWGKAQMLGLRVTFSMFDSVFSVCVCACVRVCLCAYACLS